MKTQDGFERSPNNPGAIINTDTLALQAYRAQKRKFSETDNMKEDIQNIKNNMAHINEMLVHILKRLDSNT